MPDVLIAADADRVRDEVLVVLSDPDVTVRQVTSGTAVVPAVREKTPDLVVLDLQIGNMGGMATSLDLRLEESGGRLPHVPILMLLDRRPDVFLAKRAQAEGWLIKPLDPIRLRRAIQTILAGGRYDDASFRPPEVPTADHGGQHSPAVGAEPEVPTGAS